MTDYARKVAHATSVKEIMVIREPNYIEFGEADFRFRPVFSVFDYGTIVPPVELDNRTICVMQGFNFELLAKKGIDSHYIGLVTSAGELLSANDVLARRSTPRAVIPNTTRLRFVNRVMPRFDEETGKWDYSAFQSPEANNYVHPLELMSRNDLPEASSVWKRVKEDAWKMRMSASALFEKLVRGEIAFNREDSAYGEHCSISTAVEVADEMVSEVKNDWNKTIQGLAQVQEEAESRVRSYSKARQLGKRGAK